MVGLDSAFVVDVVCRECLVDENGSRRPWWSLLGEKVLDAEGGELAKPRASRGGSGYHG